MMFTFINRSYIKVLRKHAKKTTHKKPESFQTYQNNDFKKINDFHSGIYTCKCPIFVYGGCLSSSRRKDWNHESTLKVSHEPF